MYFFDFEGKFIKLIKLDYMPLDVVALKDNKIGIMGYSNSKNFVVIKDFTTLKEKIIYSEVFGPTEKNSISINLPKSKMTFSLPYQAVNRINVSKEGNLLFASAADGVVKEYDSKGNVVLTFKLNITPYTISDEDINENYEQAVKNMNEYITRLKSKSKKSVSDINEIEKQYKQQIVKFKDRQYYPSHLPYFVNFIVDSQGNLLFFQYTNEDNSNSFVVFTMDNKGNNICTSTFKSDNYELDLFPSRFIFNNQNIYAIATKKGNLPLPLRLVKFNLSN